VVADFGTPLYPSPAESIGIHAPAIPPHPFTGTVGRQTRKPYESEMQQHDRRRPSLDPCHRPRNPHKTCKR
jgi:hypothetical protein